MSRIISFRGLIADGGQDTIPIQTIRGLIGYKVVKFQLMPNEPGEAHQEHTVKIYKIPQTVINNTVDFADNTLLGTAYYHEGDSPANPASFQVIFDNEIFNQDIYVTASDVVGATPINYYIELEQMDLNLDEATVATLKDIRNQ